MPHSKTPRADPSALEKQRPEGRWLRCGTIGAPHGTQGAVFCVTGAGEARPLSYTRVLLVSPGKVSGAKSVQEIQEIRLVEKTGLASGPFVPPPDSAVSHVRPVGVSLGGVIFVETLPGPVRKVVRSFLSGGRVVTLFESVADRTEAENLRGWFVFVDAAEVELDEDETLVADLLHCEVQCPPGVNVGRVVAVHNFGAQPTLEVALLEGKETVYFPYLAAFVLSHDVERRVMVVRDFDAFLEGTP